MWQHHRAARCGAGFPLGVNEGGAGRMIQTQQSWLITAHLNKANAGRWRSSSIMSACHKMFSQQRPSDKP